MKTMLPVLLVSLALVCSARADSTSTAPPAGTATPPGTPVPAAVAAHPPVIAVRRTSPVTIDGVCALRA